MRLWILAALAGAALTASAADYFVDSVRGTDTNAGTTPAAAWKTLDRVNKAAFKPGDTVRFACGGTWRGQFAPPSSGASGAPIVYGAYGAGAMPRIDGSGFEDAVRLYNIEYVEVRDLEITNHGRTPGVRRGVHIFLDNFGVGHAIAVTNLYIHDVNGSDDAKDNGGIIFRTNGDRVPSRFDDLRIERNIVWKADRSAIVAASYHYPRSHWNPSLRVVIRDNYVEDIGGDGIVPWATDYVLVEHNIAHKCNSRSVNYNAGIWPWSADNSIFQLNEAAFTQGTKDGQGFDSDYNSHNTLFQYNYSHDNSGGFMLICTPGKRDSPDILGNTGTIVRKNISVNDRSRIFLLSAVEHTLIEDNAIYVGPDIDVQMVLTTNWEGWGKDAIVRRNTFWVQGTARYGHEVSRTEAGAYGIAPGWGNATGIVFEGNRYYGNHVARPADAKARQLNKLRIPSAQPESPKFDPAHPENFAAYMASHRQWMLQRFEEEFGQPVRLWQPPAGGAKH